ncbi:MAG TPA: DUF3969 family protein [Tepidisphaeraceae bacterium]|jgi:hypothetical protein
MSTNGDNLITLLALSRRGKKSLERRIAELALGVVVALRSGELPVDRAWDELFNLDNYQMAKRKKLSQPLLELFLWGMELENVAEVSDASLKESFAAMERLAQQVIRNAAEPVRKLRKSA